jgi:hypothetical protein
MDPNPAHDINAWQPLTPRGVAAFAYAPLRRLLLVQFVFAVLVAGATVWFLDTAWFPTVRTAIRRLPAQGAIRSGRLNWPATSPQSLADGHFLAFTVDVKHSGAIRSPANLQVEFGQSDVRLISLFGRTDYAYPAGRWIIAFNRTELEPWWGAWRPPILWMSAGAVMIGLLAGWAMGSTIYFLAVWLAGFFANRDLPAWNCWKLSGAALMPGALLLAAGIVLYGAGVLDVVQFLAFGITHVVTGWIYGAAAVVCSPKLASAISAKGNPFTAPKATAEPRVTETDLPPP